MPKDRCLVHFFIYSTEDKDGQFRIILTCANCGYIFVPLVVTKED